MARKRTVAIVTGVIGATVGVMTVPWSALADQQILDDLIVDGSACVGLDCVNGESFGFDTLRLKENNLRIKFLDTSTTASFPSNDWQLTANDSSNGGANKFSIDDITGGRTPFTVEAGARNHALYVESDGDLGLGTNNPVVDIHNVTGNTPTMRLEQDGTSGFTPQSFDVAANEANFFIRDVTNGSTLPFRIRPGAPTSAFDMQADGDIGMGTSSPSQALDIQRSGPVGIELSNTNVEPWEFRVGNAGNFVINEDPDGLDGDEMVVTAEGDLKLEGNCIQFDGFHIPVTAAGTAVITAGDCP
jgi:hypothetical protein